MTRLGKILLYICLPLLISLSALWCFIVYLISKLIPKSHEHISSR
jgi:hypothetical protein